MSIFGTILGRLFPTNHPAVVAASTSPAATANPNPSAPSASATGQAQGGSASSSQPPVDIEQVLSGLAAKRQDKLNWHESIVDLMKLLDMDSSLTARKALAKELNYTGDQNDSAAMNIWLHKEVMNRVAANGGKVPAELVD